MTVWGNGIFVVVRGRKTLAENCSNDRHCRGEYRCKPEVCERRLKIVVAVRKKMFARRGILTSGRKDDADPMLWSPLGTKDDTTGSWSAFR